MHPLPPIEPIIAIARAAGECVRTMQPQATITGVKRDFSIITSADEAANELITQQLQQITPDIPIISEEQSEEDNLRILREHSICWVVDPLDNTAHYVAKGDSYSVNIALMKNGMPLLGVLYFPGLEEMYFTANDGHAYKQVGDAAAGRIQLAPLTADKATAAVSPDTHATHIPQSVRSLKLVFTRGQGRACLVASGVATFCSERAGFRIWDSAAAIAIIHAAGGKMLTEDGEPLFPNHSENPLELPAYFVGHPDVIDHLRPVNIYEHIPKVQGGHA